MSTRILRRAAIAVCLTLLLASASTRAAPPTLGQTLKQSGITKGLCLLIDPPRSDLPIELANASDLTICVQTSDPQSAQAARQTASRAGLLGLRVFVDHSRPGQIDLADNLADLIIASNQPAPPDAAILRALRPGGLAFIGDRRLAKPAPTGTDDWSHPYHGPSNNTLSSDRIARYPYLTQFLAQPLFSSQPEVTVAAGGRLFKAFGHMTFRAYQNPSINQLLAFSAYNGSLLWKQDLKPGFMIHRNTFIATADTLYMGDDSSCKLLDAATGQPRGEISFPPEIADGPVWKWMAIENNTLYALVGATEVQAPVAKGLDTRIGGWPWGMWPGYDYADPKTAWGFGRTLIAIDLKTRALKWHRREQQHIDSRGVCLAAGRIFYTCPEKFVACIDIQTGKDLWRSDDRALLDAIGPNGRAQHYLTGFSTSVYLRTDGKTLLFAGPQRPRLVAASADNGKLLWHKKDGNFQLVLRDNALYALGQQNTRSFKLDYATGNVLAEFVGRRACTRATGSIDSVFCRAQEGTIRWDLDTDSVNHLSPMRPACHDGVIISDGQLFWGPWICGCHLTLVGIIAAGPAGDFDFAKTPDRASQFDLLKDTPWPTQAIKADPADWPAYQSDPQRSLAIRSTVPRQVSVLWTVNSTKTATPTAPVAAGGLVFIADTNGALRALDAATGQTRWTALLGGPIFFPPAIAEGRALVGANDGYIHCLDPATGKPLWRYRVAPASRRIPVYGQIMSTWPVAGGVVVRDGVVYAAAGISHFDSTHVCALDLKTGHLNWHNNTAGTIDPQVKNGISLCGPLKLEGTELSFPGGNVFPLAQFDAATGKCLNQPVGAKTSKRMFLFPRQLWEPIENAQLSTPLGQLRLTPARGWKTFTLNFHPADNSAKPWQMTLGAFAGFAASSDTAILLSRKPEGPVWSISAVKLADGSALWSHPLPAPPVHWGLAVDANGRIVVACEDGSLLALGAK